MITDAAMIAGGLWVIGFILSKTPLVPNNLIPIILLLIGAPAQMQALGGDFTNLTHWLSALMLSGSATGLNEAIQRTKEKFTNKSDTDSP